MFARYSLPLLVGLGLLSGCALFRPEQPPVQPYAFDLNGNGTNDTNLTLGPCSAAPGSTCLLVTSMVTPNKEVLISPAKNACEGNVVGRRLEVIGDHVGDPLQEVAVLYCEQRDAGTPPALAIVDVSRGQVVARAVAPAGQRHSFSDYPLSPDGRRYPFLAPSFGDGDASFYGQLVWGYLCLYKPNLASDEKCGSGFTAVSTVPAEPFFREVGGYLQDLDGDGWEDITLIFHKLVYTISTRTAAVIAVTEYDVAAAAEPNSPKWFHDGRNYGTHSAFIGPDGKLRTLIVGGMPVGGFNNVLCNVSRFVAALESAPGRPETRTLGWSRYYGFSSTTFSEVAPAYAENPSMKVARQADFQNGCIHAFSDARSVMDREHVVIVNVFRQDHPVNTCLTEQYQLYLEPRWTPDKQRTWQECSAANLTSRGMWNVQVLRERDGVPLFNGPNAYIWGFSKDLLPSGETAYLLESLPQPTVPFDLQQHEPSPPRVGTLVNRQWTEALV